MIDFTQGAAIAALALGISSFALKSVSAFRKVISASSIMWTVHYWLLGAITTSCASALISFRNLMLLWWPKSQSNHYVFLGFLISFVALTAITWEGFVSLLPLIASVNATYAFTYCGNLAMRKMLLISSACWIINGICWNTWVPVANELLISCVNLHTIWKLTNLDTSSDDRMDQPL